jgi:ABC-type transport system involved in multi-copper enzyme maturation permease subunit
VIWLTWRQHRLAIVVAVALLVALTAAVTVLGVETSALSREVGPDRIQAAQRAGTIQQAWNLVWVVLLVLPVLAGVFLGAPLLAQDLERRTHRLLWTQGVTRRRWLVGKLGVVLAAVVLAAGLFGVVDQLAIQTHWTTPGGWSQGRWNDFDQSGLALPAYLVFAIVLGIAVGAVVRRTLLAMVITFAAYVTVRPVVEAFLRPNYMPPLRYQGSLSVQFASSSWISGFGPGTQDTQVFFYQPGDRFWAFQGIEAGLFLALTLLLLGLTWVMVLRRQA